MKKPFKKIVLPARPQPDTILAIFFLKIFGQDKYPLAKEMEVEILQDLPKDETPETLAEKGILVLDLGKGKFDHHSKNKTLSQLVAEDLEIDKNPALEKLLKYGERDDKKGLGTVSSDPIDKALGLSGLITALNKTFPNDPKKVINAILPLVSAHYQEEKKRKEDIPKEFEEKLKTKEAEIFELKQNKKNLKAVIIESDNLSMPGWLKSAEGLKADVVCQRMKKGYTNILTRPLKRVDLRWPAAYIRKAEAELREVKLKYLTADLMKAGRINEIPEWYYDRATNSILNGGTNPGGINPTEISLEDMKLILKESLSHTPEK